MCVGLIIEGLIYRYCFRSCEKNWPSESTFGPAGTREQNHFRNFVLKINCALKLKYEVC